MKKLFLLLFLIPNISYALPVTLNEYISKHPSWSSSDKASFSYITNRCGLLFVVISERYKNMTDGEQIYKMSLMNAVTFSKVSSDTYYAFGGEKKAFQERAKKWVLIYGEEAVNNIDIYGEMIHGDIKSDITTCTSKVKPILK
jgi:hypothetical protein